MHPPGADTVLVRHGDVNTKSNRVKRYMEGLLAENLEAVLADRSISGEVERRWNRPLIHTSEDAVEAATAAAADTFGVVSASPALTVSIEKAQILEALEETAREHYDGGTFAVDARRSDKTLPYDSEELAREAGTAIWETVADEFEPEVDLDDPDLTFGVEVREDVAFVYLEHVDGPGGLPLGSQEPVIALVSGGIDSPVAAYEMMKRGSPVIPAYVDLGDYGGIDHEARALETVRILSEYAPNFDMQVYEIPGGETVDLLVGGMEQGRMLSCGAFSIAPPRRWPSASTRTASSPARPPARSPARPFETSASPVARPDCRSTVPSSPATNSISSLRPAKSGPTRTRPWTPAATESPPIRSKPTPASSRCLPRNRTTCSSAPRKQRRTRYWSSPDSARARSVFSARRQLGQPPLGGTERG